MLQVKSRKKDWARRVCAGALTFILCCSPILSVHAFAEDEVANQADTTQSSHEAANPDTQNPDIPSPAEDSSSAAAPSTDNSSSNSTHTAASEESGDGSQSDERNSETNGAAEKLVQAEAIDNLIESMQKDVVRLDEEYREAKQVHDDNWEACQQAHRDLEEATVDLNAQKQALTGFVIDMYKQGGMVPYYEVMLNSTSYREFLTSWYMMNEVSLYGRNVIHDSNQEVQELQNKVTELDTLVQDAEKTMVLAHAKMKRAELATLTLAPEAALLRVEAAELSKDDKALEEALKELERANEALEIARAEGLALEAIQEGDGVFSHPCPGSVYSSGFGYRSFDNAFHKGLDMAAPEGTPYYAAESGIVIASTNDGGYNGGAGNWVVIDHGNLLTTKYMHSLVTFVRPGDYVERGQVIGLVGNTGNSFGAHLHFQVEIGNVAINPTMYL